MKKFMVALMAVLFLGSTGLVFAQAPDASATPVVKKVHKSHKHVKKVKKAKAEVAAAPAAAAPAASTTPAAK
jgi:hypothetical protein